MPTPRPYARRLSVVTVSLGLAAVGAMPLLAQTRAPSARDNSATDSGAALPRGARHALEQPGVRWSSRATPHVISYAKRGSASERRLRANAAAAERAVASTLRWLGASDSAGTIRLFFVDSRDEMVPLTSARTAGWSLTDEGTAFLVAGGSVSPGIRHEVAHLLSWRLWGAPGGVWLSEGVASYAPGRCRGYAVEDIAAALDRAGALVPLDSLRQRFVFDGDEGTVHYLQAASLVAYVDQTYGRRRLRAFWRGGLSGVKRTLGIDAATLEKRWRATVARRTPSATWAAMSARIRARGCE
jgi:hypothetical protein